MEVKQINHYATPLGVEYHFDIDCMIDCPEQFSDFFAILRQASADDIVFLHINSVGGCLDTTVQVINAMNSTAATVITSAEGMVASGAAILFFSGQGFQIADHCEFLIHTASGGGSGKISDNLSAATFQVERLNNLYRSVLGKFLTEGELDQVKHGHELYLDSETVRDRIADYIESELEEEGEYQDDGE